MAKYPKIEIRSDRELVKRFAGKNKEKQAELNLLTKICRLNKDKFWRDNIKESKPEDGKYIRSAFGPLRRFLKLSDEKILKKYDELLPCHIFARKGKSHMDAAAQLLGHSKKRALLVVDLRKFFESVDQKNIAGVFINHFGCSKKFSEFFARMTCINVGPKGSLNTTPVLARGFPTSSRIAIWCNLNFFLALKKLVHKRLKGRDPKIACYVDDIGITASKTTKNEMEKLFLEIVSLAIKHGLIVNTEKKKISESTAIKEFLGLRLNRKTIAPTSKTLKKEIVLCNQLKKISDPKEKERALNRIRGLRQYKKTIKQKNKELQRA